MDVMRRKKHHSCGVVFIEAREFVLRMSRYYCLLACVKLSPCQAWMPLLQAWWLLLPQHKFKSNPLGVLAMWPLSFLEVPISKPTFWSIHQILHLKPISLLQSTLTTQRWATVDDVTRSHYKERLGINTLSLDCPSLSRSFVNNSSGDDVHEPSW